MTTLPSWVGPARRLGSSSHALSHGLPERRRLPELHGVRGLAILGVVLFHLFGAGRVSGGIDVFLAISGFLFTAMLLREAAATGRIAVTDYLGRLVRRILAPAALVILVTAAAGLLILPVTRHGQLLTEARASLLWLENHELIRSQLSYEAAGPETSPFQHFWSLSVQGQFYLVWPLLVVLAVHLARRTGRSAAGVMGLLTSGVLVASFAWAVHQQQVDQAAAYLMSSTRAWELAFGGLLALLAVHLRLPPRCRGAAAWLGLGLVISCGFVLDGAALFPGPWALWPLLGLALILSAAQAAPEDDSGAVGDAVTGAGRPKPLRLLSSRPLARTGDLAYSLYLWHWPALILLLEITGAERLGPGGAVVVLAFSWAAAWATHRWVEVPLARLGRPGRQVAAGTSVPVSPPHPMARTASPASGGRGARRQRNTLALAAATLTVTTAAITVHLQVSTDPQEDGLAMQGMDRHLYPGASVTASEASAAAASFPSLDADEVPVFPELVGLGQRVPEYATRDCHQRTGDDPGTGEVLVCEDPRSPENPRATIMLAGGSHAGHWQHAWLMLAEEHDWEVLVATKGGCVFRHIEDLEDNQCARWNAGFAEVVAERSPDVVVTPGTRLPREPGEEFIVDGAQERWQEITDAGAELLLMRGTPRQLTNVPDCLASGGDAMSCAPDGGRFAETNPLAELGLPPGTATVDLSELFCPQGQCAAIIGNVVVYRDSHHLTNEYVETAAPYLEDRVREAMPHLFEVESQAVGAPDGEGPADTMAGAPWGGRSL
ncbi:SGNH hydrolase domain-containing protein [Nesterenkonia xinjiangensis]|uniref:Peptidoglycan/LPS O-acetylase OafA/YrhL n=1 Tax=Nesterenkonia xinjiangensis TaxID=225327 RepID=A0A7Z0KAE7_9MICC|nr:peptidoglycan/LPS O-acetylase OafA/YrhL [Nesterenkonia xinjiangensis]